MVDYLPDDAPDEEPVVADRPPLGHLGHPQVEVHTVAGAGNMSQRFIFDLENHFSFKCYLDVGQDCRS